MQIAATPENIEQAKRFLLVKWQERAVERGVLNPPADLSNACKFVSLFVQSVFGLEMRGNWNHQFNILPTGEIVDLTDCFTGYSPVLCHDPVFWNNRDHRESMDSCRPRVGQWVKDFNNLIRAKEAIS